MSADETAQVRAMLAGFSGDLSLEQLRAAYDGMGAAFGIPDDVTVTPQMVGNLPAEWTWVADAAADRVILYLHGGGFTTGSLVSHRHGVAELGRLAKCRTLALDYRLAPEHPFPAAVDDCLEGYRFLLGKGIAPANIAIAGDSAGAGLVVSLLAAARDAGLPQPACGVCFSPWVDLEAMGGTIDSKAGADPLVSRDALLMMAGAYRAGADPRDPRISPLYAELAGLAPLLIQVGTAEALLDDSVRLATRAGVQNVDVRLELWPDMVHVWHFFFPILSEGRRALGVAADYIRGKLENASA